MPFSLDGPAHEGPGPRRPGHLDVAGLRNPHSLDRLPVAFDGVATKAAELITVPGPEGPREVRLTSPDKVYFPERGIHVFARIRPEWDFIAVRHAVIAIARRVAERLPEQATVDWWKEERG